MRIARRFNGPVIAVLMGAGMCVAMPRAARGQAAGKPAVEETIMTDLIQDLVRNKYKPVKGIENIPNFIASLPQRSESELQEDLAKVKRLKAREGENYRALFASRVANVSRASFDPAIAVARMMGWAREKEQSLAELHHVENQLFLQKYGFTLHDSLITHTADDKKVVEQYMRTKQAANFLEQEQALIKDYDQRLKDIVSDYKNMRDPNEIEIDKLTRETLDRYQQLVTAQREVEAALDRIRHPTAPPVKERSTAVKATGGSLSVKCGQSEFEMAVGEAAAVELFIEGGTPPYRLIVRDVESKVLLEITITEAGTRFIPVSFSKPGTHTVTVEVSNSAFPVDIAKLNLQFRVIADTETPEEPTKQPQVQPHPTATPTLPPKPPDESFAPRRLPPGTYQAQLWPGLNLVSGLRKNEPLRSLPVPVTVTFDAAGNVTGKADWKLPAADMHSNYVGPDKAASDELKFRLEGAVDWNSGAMDLKLSDGAQTRRITYTSPLGFTKMGDDLEYDFTMKGWQLGHPALTTSYLDMFAKYPLPEPRNDMEFHGMPQFSVGADGKVAYRDFGWAGNPALATASGHSKLSPGPGGYSRLNLKKYNSWLESNNQPRKDEDQKPKVATMWPEYSGWYLKILGQAAPEQPAAPPAVLNDRRDLVAFGIWPMGTVDAKPGEGVKLDAMGVFIEDPFNAENLSAKVKWELPPGVTRSADGTLTASAPGTYQVKVSIRCRDGRTLSDTVRVHVTSKDP